MDFLAQIDPLLNNRRYLGRSMMFGFCREPDVVFMSCKVNFYVVRFTFTSLLSIQARSVHHQGQAGTVLDIAILSKLCLGVLPPCGRFQTNKQNKTQNTKMSQLSRKKKIFADCFIAKTCAKFHAVILTPRLNKARRKAKHVHNTLSSFDRFVIFCVGIRLRVDSSYSINRDITR